MRRAPKRYMGFSSNVSVKASRAILIALLTNKTLNPLTLGLWLGLSAPGIFNLLLDLRKLQHLELCCTQEKKPQRIEVRENQN